MRPGKRLPKYRFRALPPDHLECQHSPVEPGQPCSELLEREKMTEPGKVLLIMVTTHRLPLPTFALPSKFLWKMMLISTLRIVKCSEWKTNTVGSVWQKVSASKQNTCRKEIPAGYFNTSLFLNYHCMFTLHYLLLEILSCSWGRYLWLATTW